MALKEGIRGTSWIRNAVYEKLQKEYTLSDYKVAEAKETLGEQLADIKEKALANIDTIKNTQLKSQPNPFIGGPLSPMLTEEKKLYS